MQLGLPLTLDGELLTEDSQAGWYDFTKREPAAGAEFVVNEFGRTIGVELTFLTINSAIMTSQLALSKTLVHSRGSLLQISFSVVIKLLSILISIHNF